MNFADLSNKEQEKIMISEIIRNLKKLGGYATKRELLDAIKKGENTIDENFFEEEKVSQKSGKIYKPSDYTFNFSAKKPRTKATPKPIAKVEMREIPSILLPSAFIRYSASFCEDKFPSPMSDKLDAPPLNHRCRLSAKMCSNSKHSNRRNPHKI